MFAILVKQNLNILRFITMENKCRMFPCGVSHSNMSYSKRVEHEEEDDDDSDDEDEQEMIQRACPPDPCKPPHSTAPCFPAPPPPPGRISNFLGAFGAKQISILMAFIPGLLRYGVVALFALIYMTEFETLLQFLPFYNGKYQKDDAKSVKKEE